MARLTKYNKQIANKILRLYSQGVTILDITSCKDMPGRTTIYDWRTAYPEFGKAYNRAIEAHSDFLVDQALSIVDNEPDPKRAKVQADYRCWLVAKINRSKYGDKIDIDIKQTVDISPALALAVERMRSIGTGNTKLIEADITE